ncbi:divalent-cation tolerance protein CutA [Salinisphaera sp.]|uniref:divalent-cation tolerance protein CutA n=1 Tax=Salinisphaera sp. TaxID=1914330 RepID=UPI002D79099E|nr:divalent-cation tolerance protein CutA [Salinisphaera sp.]HET7314228.1 divalent-cation tolerance protein CutA [Salinisphaera sp.]
MSNPADQEAVVVYVTAPERETARAIASALVENREAACVNIVAGVESVYRWQGEIEVDDELLLVIKTRAARLAAIDARLAELHPDEVPERITLPITDGSPAYLDWLLEQTG